MADLDSSTATGKAPGALLTDAQIRKLRIAVIVMSLMLVAGVATVIARIVYLANRGSEQATVSRGADAVLAPESRLALPAGATVKSTSLAGNRLTAHYTSPKGEGVLIHDLVTGKTVSHVRFDVSP